MENHILFKISDFYWQVNNFWSDTYQIPRLSNNNGYVSEGWNLIKLALNNLHSK